VDSGIHRNTEAIDQVSIEAALSASLEEEHRIRESFSYAMVEKLTPEAFEKFSICLSQPEWMA
jgi:hypothetical protein